MKGKPSYKSLGRNGYGAVDYHEGMRNMRNVMAGIKPQYLADEIEGHLNDAINKGVEWTKLGITACNKRKDFKKCLIEMELLESN